MWHRFPLLRLGEEGKVLPVDCILSRDVGAFSARERRTKMGSTGMLNQTLLNAARCFKTDGSSRSRFHLLTFGQVSSDLGEPGGRSRPPSGPRATWGPSQPRRQPYVASSQLSGQGNFPIWPKAVLQRRMRRLPDRTRTSLRGQYSLREASNTSSDGKGERIGLRRAKDVPDEASITP